MKIIDQHRHVRVSGPKIRSYTGMRGWKAAKIEEGACSLQEAYRRSFDIKERQLSILDEPCTTNAGCYFPSLMVRIGSEYQGSR